MANTITIVAEECDNLDTTCYRGSAPLCELARISTADVFDQDLNPEGLQRDLSRKHAAEAYDYVAGETVEADHVRAFPEVILNVRDRGVVDVKREDVTIGGRKVRMVAMTFDVDKIQRARTPKVSRVDGNHRLFYADGDDKERRPLETMAPFQLHVGLTRDQEANLFLDVNSEQKGLNTSHLHFLRSRLTPEDVELERAPERAFAKRLTTDASSPWFGLVHLGGSRAGQRELDAHRPVTFVALESAVRRILRNSLYLKDQLTDPDGQYAIIRTYWQAVAKVYADEWANPQDFYVLKNIGIQALAQLGARIIDRAMMEGNVEVDDMAALIEHTTDVIDWHKDAPMDKGVTGMSGNRAALLVAERLVKAVPKPQRGQAVAA